MTTASPLRYGADFSHWNAVTDAGALHTSGIEFAWLKATEGVSGVDATFADKAAELTAAGVIVGPYHFFDGGDDPVAEAKHFLEVAGPYLSAGRLAWMLDMEAALARGAANAEVAAFAQVVNQPGLVYANVDWWGNTLDSALWGAVPLHGVVASWNGQPGSPAYQIANTAYHQFNDKLARPGVAGVFDGDCTLPGIRLEDFIVGGAPTPAPAPAPAPVPTPPNPWNVRPGDTLSGIAAAWGVTVSAVAVANAIPDPNLIHVGQILWKPGTHPIDVPVPAPVTTGGHYTVMPGDTVSGIAARFSCTVAQIVYLNHLANPDRIIADQVLELPNVGGQGGAGQYLVRSGDTLSAIAAHLNYPGGWPALARANDVAGPGYVIHPGQILHY